MKQYVMYIFTSVILLLSHPNFAYDLLTDRQIEELNALENTHGEEDDDFASKTLTPPTPGPKIELIKPEIENKLVKVPLDIELFFRAPDDADIDADSLRIFYRKYGKYFNVTETVLENAVFEKNRLISKNATITKKGQHRIKVVIKDTLGRRSEETFRFKI